MNCKNCGKEAKKGDKFCTFCGQVLDQGEAKGEGTTIYRIVEMPENPLYSKKEDLQWTAQQEVVEEEEVKKKGPFRRLIANVFFFILALILIIALLSFLGVLGFL